MSADIRKLLSMPDKGIHLAEDVLTKLYRKVWADISMTDYHWQSRIRRYLEDPTNRIPNNPNARSSHRGNLNKELSSPRMSWNVFFKGLKFLGPWRLRFKLEIDWTPNRTTYHELQMVLNTTDYPVIEEKDKTPAMNLHYTDLRDDTQ